MVDFSNIILDERYDRITLAKMWDYKSIDAIRRGVVAPQGKELLILFITKEKHRGMTPYEDRIDQDILYWEGERAHGYDGRIVTKKDIVHVFYREKERIKFIYKGRAVLTNYNLGTVRPSKFKFQLIDQTITDESIVEDVKQAYGLTETEKIAIIMSRRGQGLFRSGAIDLWKTCSVTGFSKNEILIASHIKPWKVSSNEERINPQNSLLLVPTLDKLFDRGYIGFESSGKLLRSEKISPYDWKSIGLDSDVRLRRVPNDVKKFLEYHSEYIFDLA